MAQIKIAEYTFDNTIEDLKISVSPDTIQTTIEDSVDGNITRRIVYIDENNGNNYSIGSFYQKQSLLSIDYLMLGKQNQTLAFYFGYCDNLKIVNIDCFSSGRIVDTNSAFVSCGKLVSLNISNLDTSEVTTMWYMFAGCSSLTSLDLSNFNTENVTNMGHMFAGCSSLTSLDLSNFNTENVTNIQEMFNNCSSLTSLNVSNFNTENVTSMQGMFYNCSKLTSLDVSNLNTQNVTNMQNMFRNCSLLTSLDVSNFNTENVTTTGWMFQNCSSLTSLDVSNFNTENVTNMGSMFQNCSSLTSLDVSNFNTENVTNMSYIFQNCSSLTSLDVSNFNTENVTNMSYIFGLCEKLTVLDISNFNILPTTTITDMINNVGINRKIDIGAIHCNDTTIKSICNCIGGDANRKNNTTIWHTLNEYFSYEEYNLQRYQLTTLSLNEPVQLRSIGDVHDEINYETGEYIQRIGECIYEDDVAPTYNKQIGGYLAAMEVKGNIGLAVVDGMGAISDKLINRGFTDYDFGIYGNLDGNLRIFDKTVKSEEEFITKYRGTKFQFILLEPIITKIDTTILDQNNSYKSSQQTYDEQTYISVQSDTVVTPTSSVDYEIYSSTGTITGTSATIENAEAGTPVSGVVYGETLLNVIQESSEDEFVCTDNFSGKETTIENSVAGNVKDVIIKGQTLVNLLTYFMSSVSYIDNQYRIIFSDVGNFDKITVVNKNSKPIKFSYYTSNWKNYEVPAFNNVLVEIPEGVITYNIISSDTFGWDSTNYREATDNIVLLHGDYVNQDIPYFEGIGSVTNYRIIENMQPTCTYSENSGTYWCDTTTVNPTVGNQYFIKIFNNPNNAITRFFYGGVIVDTTTDYAIITATDSTGMRLHFYNLNSATVTITEEEKNAIRFLICEYQDGMENWEINEHFEESYIVQMPILKTTGKNLLNDNTSVSGWITEDGTTTIRGVLGSGSDYLSDFIYVGNINQIKINGGYYVTTFDENKKFISQFANVADVNVSNCSYIRIGVSCGGQAALSLVGTIQVEEGSVATSYEPYKSTTVTVNENIELNSIGDVCDELNVTTGELIQRIDKVVLDGGEDKDLKKGTWDKENTVTFYLRFDETSTQSGILKFLCNELNFNNNFYSVDEECILYTANVDGTVELYIRLLRSRLEDVSVEGLKSYLSKNPIIVLREHFEPVIKTVNLSIVNQDNVQQKYVQLYDTITYLKPQSYELIPIVEYKNPTYDVLLKENTQYTIKLNRTNIIDGTPLTVNLGGTELSIEDSADSFTITTPSTLTNNTLSIGGANNKVKEVMIIEGDYVDRDLDFFEGFVSVENPILMITNDNYWSGAILPEPVIESFDSNYNSYINTKKPILKLKPNTEYYANIKLTPHINEVYIILFEYNEKGEQATKISRYVTPTNNGWGTTGYTQFKTTNGELYLRFYPGYKQQDIEDVYKVLRTAEINIFEKQKYNSSQTFLGKQGNILTTYPQVTLRSIGDIKDEWDMVGETVTRRIGEIVLDGSADEQWSGCTVGDICTTIRYESDLFINQTSIANHKTNIFKSLNTFSNEDMEGSWIQKHTRGQLTIKIFNSRLETLNIPGFKKWLSQNPLTVVFKLAEPVTESVRITPPNPQASSASITIPTQLNHVEDTSDFLVWNPYKEHYVRYNYVEDGVILDNYTWENLTDLNERQFVEFYNRRTYIDQPYHSYVASHDSKGTSKYVLIEPNQDYTVNVRFSELPTCETVKVNLGGTEVEMNVNDPHVHITTPNTLLNNLCSISGDGLDGKVTDILVIHCLEHDGFADIDYFEGIDGIGEIVEVDGVSKVNITMEQTNGNLLDFEPIIFNNGNYISVGWNENIRAIPLKANTSYRLKMRKTKDVTTNNGWGDTSARLYTSEMVSTRNINMTLGGTFEFTTTNNEKYLRFYKQQSHNGNTNIHEPLELTYAHFTDNELIRPRYYDKEEILLPMQLHRINTVYDNFYYDEMKGFYRIQQSIGHKYFVGADSENWTLIERGQRVLRFRYNNADIQIKSLGEFMTNRLPNGTATSPYECCAFSGSTFIVSIDKERLTSESLIAFKEWLANNNLHLYYQLASPLMIDLPQYPNRIEFNTYKDEIYTFFKNCKPTVFTLNVPLDQTYRFYDLEEGQGCANRIELTDERMTEEDKLYVHTIYGSGISNLIEEPNNVDTMLKPNYEGKATSHSLINGKVSSIGIHGFEPNDVTIENYNTVTKQYELTVQAQKGTNTNTETLAVPYKLEIYEDGTKDRVYYNSQYKQWMFEGGQTLTVPYNESTGAFASAVEVFRGLQPRSGLIGEFKVRFASGTTSARLYYSINGTTYGYTTLRGMTDEVDYYIGFFNTGGTKIDMGTKTDANAEYTTLVPINATIPECLMINQIQSITECTYYQDKTYYYSDVISPLLLDVYNGTTTITELNGAIIDIQNNAHNKQALIYGDTTYTVYWTYVGGEGNIKVTLGGATQEVVATQGYVTITTSNTDLERGLLIGGFDVTIKDLMLIKGERITDLKYFEGSRAVGTAFTDEDGNTMYKITFVTGSELINDKFEDMITFEDNKKHNVVVTKLLGAKPDKN